MARSLMLAIGGMRWENDENVSLLSEQSNVLRRAGTLSRPIPRTPLKEITHLFPTDSNTSSRKRNSSRNRSGAHGSNRKRRVSQAISGKTDRQSALLRKLR